MLDQSGIPSCCTSIPVGAATTGPPPSPTNGKYPNTIRVSVPPLKAQSLGRMGQRCIDASAVQSHRC